MRRPELLLALALPCAAEPAAAQAVRFVYAPQLGQLTRTVTESRTTTTLVGFPSVPDGAVVESEVAISASQRVVRFEDERVVLDVVVDSVRGRQRLDGGRWVDVAEGVLVGQVARAVVSPRFGIVGLRSSNPTDADVLQTLGAFAAGLGFSFPDTAVTVGTTFATGGRLRARVRTEAGTGLALDEVVFGDLALTLDSVAGAGPNQVSYLTLRGEFAPRVAAEGGESGDVVTTLSGAFAGRLAWSAGWGAFVSGALRLRVTGEIRFAGARGTQTARATWERTVIHHVRP